MSTIDEKPIKPCVRNEFLAAISQLEDEFKNAKFDIEQREANLKRALDDLEISTSALCVDL